MASTIRETELNTMISLWSVIALSALSDLFSGYISLRNTSFECCSKVSFANLGSTFKTSWIISMIMIHNLWLLLCKELRGHQVSYRHGILVLWDVLRSFENKISKLSYKKLYGLLLRFVLGKTAFAMWPSLLATNWLYWCQDSKRQVTVNLQLSKILFFE